jgi:hypothetical protein
VLLARRRQVLPGVNREARAVPEGLCQWLAKKQALSRPMPRLPVRFDQRAATVILVNQQRGFGEFLRVIAGLFYRAIAGRGAGN